MADLEERKRSLRKEIRTRRRALSEEDRRAATRAIALTILGMREYRNARLVLAYASTAEEVGTEEIIDSAISEGKTVLLPRMEEERLVLHTILGRFELIVGPFGILEPPPACPIAAPQAVDFAVIPGVAFDAARHRLGMGKGYYDRLIPNLEKAYLVGLAFEAQIVDEVPREERDRAVDAVVTEKRVLRETARE